MSTARSPLPRVAVFLALAASITVLAAMPHVRPRSVEREERPSDWFGMQRAFPFATIDQEAFRRATEWALVEHAARRPDALMANFTWEQAGPFNIGGRVTALAVAPGGNTIYLGAAAGGVFKSTNAGVNWTPIFDGTGIFSIGALALAPNLTTIWCGTGEANGSVDSYDGAGVFRSTDSGQSWSSMGLEATRRIGRVAVDPGNPDRIFVAGMGAQFSTGPDRGLYRSEDGGQNWTKVLFVNDSTGVCDVVINPAHPETVYCASWERVRHYTYRRAFGPGCGIWRSIDHGTTWTRLQTGLPAPSDNVGRIGLAIAASRPSTVYAQIITGSAGGYTGLGLYRTTNGGATWARRDVAGFTGSFGGFGWYFGDMAVDPTNSERVYALGQVLVRSTNGGQNFSDVTGNAHVDEHAFWIDPANPQRVFMGSDGGFFWSLAGGSSWSKSVDLPITQFYAGTIDPSNPARLMGGTQDNNTLLTSGSPTAWIPVLGGDGFQCLIDPIDPNVMFAEYQFCSGGEGPYRSADGGDSFSPPDGFAPSDRYNWNSPIVMSPLDHSTLLVGSQRVYRSRNNGLSYSPISPDLTTNNVGSLLTYSTLTTLEVAAADTATYFTGSDDGKVHRSTNSGSSWTDISTGLPIRWITRVTSDPTDADVVYVTLSGFGQDEHLAHVYRSTDRGGSWASIAGNLPDVPANDLIVDPIDPNRLFLATDIGVYATADLGGYWLPLGQGMPIQTVFDLTLHAPSRTLVAATHGRSQWKLDLNDLPVAVEPALAAPRLALSSPVPNPSRGEARFTLDLSARGKADVTLFDAFGRRIRNLHRGALEPGRHVLRWDGRDDHARIAPAGVYYARAALGDRSAMTRLVRVN